MFVLKGLVTSVVCKISKTSVSTHPASGTVSSATGTVGTVIGNSDLMHGLNVTSVVAASAVKGSTDSVVGAVGTKGVNKFL